MYCLLIIIKYIIFKQFVKTRNYLLWINIDDFIFNFFIWVMQYCYRILFIYAPKSSNIATSFL